MLFNRTPLLKRNEVEPVAESVIKNTFGLFRADLETAMMYGGEATRRALSGMKFHGDRKYITVDTKIHMLMPKFCPAIPGWHTDGVPRLTDPRDLSTANTDFGQPNIHLQESLPHSRYHILVFGENTTEFIEEDSIDLEVQNGCDHDLYRKISKEVNEKVKRYELKTVKLWPNTVYEFDWWRVHRAPIATRREWRYLIRVTESDWYTPKTDLEDVIRKQSQVYAPMEYGW
jgi:hypothetical protein